MKKFTDLTMNYRYTVISYKPVKTPYGDSYILMCTNNYNYDEVFEMFATPGIADYIRIYEPIKKFAFTFTVKQSSKYKYAEIDKYS